MLASLGLLRGPEDLVIAACRQSCAPLKYLSPLCRFRLRSRCVEQLPSADARVDRLAERHGEPVLCRPGAPPDCRQWQLCRMSLETI